MMELTFAFAAVAAWISAVAMTTALRDIHKARRYIVAIGHAPSVRVSGHAYSALFIWAALFAGSFALALWAWARM